MSIVIHPKARKTLIAIVMLALAAIVLLSLRSAIFPNPEESITGLTPDAQAAVEAVTAFYTLDYTASPQLWISNMCALATEKGCDAIRSFYAPIVKTRVQNFQVQTSCTVQPVRLVADHGDSHLWQVRATLDHPWAGLDAPTQDIYVEVVKLNGGWLMNRILFKQEAKRFTAPVH